MIKLKSLLSEYVTEPVSALAKYLNSSEEDKKVELAFAYPQYIYQFLGAGISDDEEALDAVERLYSKDRTKFNEFANHVYNLYSRGIISKDNLSISGYPTWQYMDFRGYVKNQWLIHFSDNAYDIWHSQTFKYGYDDFTALGLTTFLSKDIKKHGGYNFAYDTSDYLRYGRSSFRSGEWKYGKEAVLFRASGIKVWHNGDEEPQVVFEGRTAKDIVYIENTDPGPWGVTNSKLRRPIYIGGINDVVVWVEKNFNQYKKVLLP